MRNAIENARANLRRSWGIESDRPIEIRVAKPEDSAGLQAVDYFLWALQRLYIKQEPRFWESIADKVRLVHDVDDCRQNDYGVYYTSRNPLTIESIKEREPGI